MKNNSGGVGSPRRIFRMERNLSSPSRPLEYFCFCLSVEKLPTEGTETTTCLNSRWWVSSPCASRLSVVRQVPPGIANRISCSDFLCLLRLHWLAFAGRASLCGAWARVVCRARSTRIPTVWHRSQSSPHRSDWGVRSGTVFVWSSHTPHTNDYTFWSSTRVYGKCVHVSAWSWLFADFRVACSTCLSPVLKY